MINIRAPRVGRATIKVYVMRQMIDSWRRLGRREVREISI